MAAENDLEGSFIDFISTQTYFFLKHKCLDSNSVYVFMTLQVEVLALLLLILEINVH